MVTRIVKLYPQRLSARKLNFCMIDNEQPEQELLIFENMTITQGLKLLARSNFELLVIWENRAYEFAPDPVRKTDIILGRCVAEVA